MRLPEASDILQSSSAPLVLVIVTTREKLTPVLGFASSIGSVSSHHGKGKGREQRQADHYNPLENESFL